MIASDSLLARFVTGCYLVSSNLIYKAFLDTNNLSIFNTQNGTQMWTETFIPKTHLNYYMLIQTDGNLVVYDGISDQAIWADGYYVSSAQNYKVSMENDGRLKLYDGQNILIKWV